MGGAAYTGSRNLVVDDRDTEVTIVTPPIAGWMKCVDGLDG